MLDADGYVAPLKVTDFAALSDIHHLLYAPDMYVGSTRPCPELMWTMYPDRSVHLKEITLARALRSMFREIIWNACDNVVRSMLARVNPGTISVSMSNTRISVKNGGLPINVEVHPDTGVWLPELLFSRMKSGSNFNAERKRTGGGRNGVGAVVVNGFSSYFSCYIEDAARGKTYFQEWINTGGPQRSDIYPRPPVIGDFFGTESSVTVTYDAELWRFGIQPSPILGFPVYPEEAYHIFMMECADASFTAKVPVIFNGTVLDYRNPLGHSALRVGTGHNYTLYYEWERGVKVLTNPDGTQVSALGTHLPTVEAIVLDTNTSKVALGFCNSVTNTDGGIHVNAVIKGFAEAAISLFDENEASKARRKRREAVKKRTAMKGPGKRPTKKGQAEEKVKHSLTPKDVKRNISLIVNVRVPDPEWNNQTKSRLDAYINKDGSTGTFKVEFKDNQSLRSWGLIARLEVELKRRRLAILSRANATKTSRVKLTKGKDALWAGGPNASQTRLCPFEGDSAENYMKVIRKYMGAERLGLISLGGKIKKVIDADPDKVVKNVFFREFNQMMGLRAGVDYTILRNLKTLRYGGILLATDADEDGKHIKGLFINFIQKYYPSLLEVPGFITEFKTKYLAARKNGRTIKFLNEFEFNIWTAHTPDWKTWDLTYYKGLGSSSKEQALDDWNNKNIVTLAKDPHTDSWIRTVFEPGKEASQTRRNIILHYMSLNPKPYTPVPPNGTQYLSSFFAEDFVTYSVADIIRHMPRRDGFQPTNRKIIFAAICLWRWWRGGEREKQRVDTFSSYVVRKADYHHGDLSGVVIRMAQDFPGSNNIQYLVPDGMFGTRDEGGKDAAAARYPYTYPNSKHMSHIIKERDDDLLTYQVSQERKKKGGGPVYIEPLTYYPVIPMHVVNGVDGIMSAFRSFIPCHHPVSVARWLINRIHNRPQPTAQQSSWFKVASPIPTTLTPWYRGFRGTIEVIDKREIQYKEITVYELIAGSMTPVVRKVPELKGYYFMVTKGIVQITGPKSGIVTELPVGMWTSTYVAMLDKMRDDGLIQDYIDESTFEDVKITITGFKFEKDRDVTFDDFRITKRYSLSNIYVLNDDNIPMKFDSIEAVMEDFYQWRLPAYRKKHQLDIEKYRLKLSRLDAKIRYIQAVLDHRLVIVAPQGQPPRLEEEVLRDIDALGLDRAIYTEGRVSDKSYNNRSLLALQKERESAARDLATVEAQTPEGIWLKDLEELIVACSDIV